MTPEAQRIAIAEVCGWVEDKYLIWRRGHEVATTETYCPAATNRLPDYLNDLNAMHEAEKVLNAGRDFRYRELLSGLSGKRNAEYISVEAALCHATAAQRAEAFLRTLGLWKE